jgi:prophage antirepressor-like protein
MTMADIQTFDFAPGLPLRSITTGDELWFVAKDICDALGLRVDNAVQNLDADEKANTALQGFARGATIVNESGLYSLIMRSRKPAAKAFQRWVTATVLPTLRRDGLYVSGQELPMPAEMSEGQLLAHLEDVQARLDALKAAKIAEFRAMSIEHRSDRYDALKTLRRIQGKGRSTRQASAR